MSNLQVVEEGRDYYVPQFRKDEKYIPQGFYPRRYAVIAPVYPDYHLTCACGYSYILTDEQYNKAPYPETCYQCNNKRAKRERFIAAILKEFARA